MDNFDFYNPTKIFFGKDRLFELDKQVPKDAKVLVLYGGGSVKKYGTLNKVLSALGDRDVLEFSGIEPNPKFETLVKAVKVVKENNIDFLLAVGGGSVIDGTKFVAVAASYDKEDYETLLKNPTIGSSVPKPIPLATVLTLPATGSESNSGAVISYDGDKYILVHKETYPVFSFLDPTLTYTLPKVQVANGVIDAFVHVCEQYVTYPVNAMLQDSFSEGILLNLIEIGSNVIEKPNDYDLKANLMWNATLALNGLIGSGVPQDWATHMIGHQLTANYGIDHAQTLAIILPAVWKVRKEQKREKLLQYAQRVWHLEGDQDAIIDQAIDKTEEFFQSLGVKTKMSDYGIKESDIGKILTDLKRKGVTELSETKDLGLDEVKKILELAL